MPEPNGQTSITIPQLGVIDEQTLSQLAGSNVMLSAHNKALIATCEALQERIDAMSAELEQVKHPTRVRAIPAQSVAAGE